MITGDRVQAKANGHRGTLIAITPGFDFTVRYDGERDEKRRRIRGPLVTYPWRRLVAFNFGRKNPGTQDG